MKTLVACIVLAAAANSAYGQAGWIFATEYAPGQTSVTPQFPTASIRISAFFAPNDYAVAGLRWDVRAAEPGWVPGEYYILAPFTPAHAGLISGSSIANNIAGLLNFPAGGIYADPRNPIPVFVALWRATDFRPRSVALGTRTARFDVYPDRESPSSTSRLSTVVEGAGQILVTPAPGATVLFGVGVLAAVRRRRRER